MLNAVQPLMDYALNLLGQRSYTASRLREKLTSRAKRLNLSEGSIDRVMDRLHELNYLNDYRFAEQFVQSRCQLKPRGKRFLDRELLQKGISAEIRQQLWAQMELDEHALAETILERALKRYHRFSGYPLKQKCFQALSSKGFSYEVIKDVLDKTLASP